MELRRYASLLGRWLWLILLGTALAAGTSFLVSSFMAKVYEASTTLLVNQAQNPGGVSYNDVLTSERLTKTYGELIRKRPVLERALAELKLPYSTEELGKRLSVRVVRDTMLVELKAESTDPKEAADLANAVARAFIEESRRTQTGQASLSLDALREQLRSLERDIRSTSDQIEQLKSSQDGRSAEARQVEIARLQGILSQYQTSYYQLLKSEQDMRLAEARTFGSIVVAEPATVSLNAVRPKVAQNVLLAALVGLMLAVGVVLLIEYLDDTVKSSDDVARILGAPTLGYLARLRGRQVEELSLPTQPDPRSPMAEAFRVVRTNLQFSQIDRPNQTVLFTSAGPGEGKTTLVANLARVMAQAGMRVIVVDADLRRPSLHRHFGLKNDVGLTNALLRPDPLEAGILRPTDLQNLEVVTSGPVPPNPAELVGSLRMTFLVKALQERADVVLFDAPPMVVTDPAVLARLVEGVVVVVDASSTRAEALSRVKEALAQVGCADKLLGAVLNKLTSRSEGYYYYSQQYYAHDRSGKGGRRRGDPTRAKTRGAGQPLG